MTFDRGVSRPGSGASVARISPATGARSTALAGGSLGRARSSFFLRPAGGGGGPVARFFRPGGGGGEPVARFFRPGGGGGGIDLRFFRVMAELDSSGAGSALSFTDQPPARSSMRSRVASPTLRSRVRSPAITRGP